METMIVIAGLGAALQIALWAALIRKLRELPLAVSRAAQRSRAADEARAMDALQAAASARLGGLVIGVQAYHDRLADVVRMQVAEAEMRARVSERRASEAGVALSAASALVRDLRRITEDFPALMALSARSAAHVDLDEPKPARDPDERATVEIVRASRVRPVPVKRDPQDEERPSGEEELTMVQQHPLASPDPGGAS